MGTALAKREEPRGYSVTPKGKPHIRVLHIPYHYQQLAPTIEVFRLPQGCELLDWALDLKHLEWVFIIDVSKEVLDEESEFVHHYAFDFRSMMRGG